MPQSSSPSASSTTAPPGSLLRSFHIIFFFLMLVISLVFLTVLLYSSGDMHFRLAATKVFKRLLKTVAMRQVADTESKT